MHNPTPPITQTFISLLLLPSMILPSRTDCRRFPISPSEGEMAGVRGLFPAVVHEFNARTFVSLLLLLFLSCATAAAQSTKVVDLWPGPAPDEKKKLDPEQDTTKPSDNLIAGKSVIRLGNISRPTISLYPAKTTNEPRPAIIVCPGGGYHILAMDLEGTEVCEWLNSIGVTGILLKYRVPKREGLPKHAPALQDAQRALGLVRYHARDWGIDPNHIGILGFSAGGHLAAALCSNPNRRTYSPIDPADTLSCRPDFALLIYPGGLLPANSDELPIEVQPSTNTPPTFIAMAADDPVRVENAFAYSSALRKLKVPIELHVYAKGGHGYGLRPRADLPVTTWPQRASDWLRSQDLLR